MWWKRKFITYVGEHSERQGHLGESRVVLTLNMWQREPNAAARRPELQKGEQATKMSG